MFPRVHAELRLLFSGDAPRGFGKFFPKNGKSGGSSSAGGKAGEQGAKQGTKQGSGSAKEAGEETLKSKSSSSNSKKGSQKGAPGGPKPPDQDTIQKLVGGSILLTILAFMLLSEGGNWGSEINWHDFQTDLLESGQVERIVVINNKVSLCALCVLLVL
jgi:AFG3 family protein